MLIPFVGRLTDRVGRRPVLLAGSIGILVLNYLFFLAFASGDYALIVLAQALACGILALAIVPQVALIAELFPTSVRLSSFALATAQGVVLFGGTAPLIATYLGRGDRERGRPRLLRDAHRPVQHDRRLGHRRPVPAAAAGVVRPVYRHVILFRWQHDATPEQVAAAHEHLATLTERLPQIRSFSAGPDVGRQDHNADYALVADFATKPGTAPTATTPTTSTSSTGT